MSCSSENSTPGPGPAPTRPLRRELVARGQRMKASLAVGRQGVTTAFSAQVRQFLEQTDLVKVRIEADDRDEAERLATQLGSLVPCHFVQRVGRVVLLYRQLREKSG